MIYLPLFSTLFLRLMGLCYRPREPSQYGKLKIGCLALVNLWSATKSWSHTHLWNWDSFTESVEVAPVLVCRQNCVSQQYSCEVQFWYRFHALREFVELKTTKWGNSLNVLDSFFSCRSCRTWKEELLFVRRFHSILLIANPSYCPQKAMVLLNQLTILNWWQISNFHLSFHKILKIHYWGTRQRYRYQSSIEFVVVLGDNNESQHGGISEPKTFLQIENWHWKHTLQA